MYFYLALWVAFVLPIPPFQLFWVRVFCIGIIHCHAENIQLAQILLPSFKLAVHAVKLFRVFAF